MAGDAPLHTPRRPEATDATVRRIKRRMIRDLGLDDRDMDGVEEILDEEISRLDDALRDWACDKCGVRKSTCTRGVDGPSLCNSCAFGDS